MTRVAIFLGGMIAGAIITTVGLYFAFFDFHVLEEIKVCRANIEKPDISPQLRECLKERLYWNVAVWMRHRRDFFTGSSRLDYGPIETNALGTARGIKDCSSSEEVYRGALTKFGMNMKPQPSLSPRRQDKRPFAVAGFPRPDPPLQLLGPPLPNSCRETA